MRNIIIALFFVIATASVSMPAEQPTNIPSAVTLFKNVKIFDGKSDGLKEGFDVLVVKNKIHKIASEIPNTGTWQVDIDTGRAEESVIPAGGLYGYSFTTYSGGEKVTKEVKVNVIDGGGRTLMPGLIDSHTHLYATGAFQTFAGLRAAPPSAEARTGSPAPRHGLADPRQS